MFSSSLLITKSWNLSEFREYAESMCAVISGISKVTSLLHPFGQAHNGNIQFVRHFLFGQQFCCLWFLRIVSRFFDVCNKKVQSSLTASLMQSLSSAYPRCHCSGRRISTWGFTDVLQNEKYLEKSDSLIRAVKQLLQIDELANDKDQQYKYVLQCPTPAKIVLCENLDLLKRPSKPRKHNIELWYAGGKNINKLNYIGPINLPIFYSCDWDYDGLLIYQMVKDIIPQIRLLPPTGVPKSIKATDHNSHWNPL